MDIETLKLFCDVMRLKGFTQAAEANSITQSAVSQRLKSLEKKFGIPLIERHGAELHLTKAGEALYRGARRILTELREVEDRVQEIKGHVGGSVKVAAIYSVGLYQLNPFVKNFLRSHPEIDVQIEYSRASKIYQDVSSGLVDLGMVAYPANRPQLRCIPFREDDLVLICPAHHPLSQHESISVKELDSQPFVNFQKNVPTRKALEEILKKHGVSVVTKAEFENIELIKRAVEIGLGFSIIPSTTVKTEVQAGILKAISFKEGPFLRPIGIVYRRGRVLPAAAKQFISVLTDSAAPST